MNLKPFPLWNTIFTEDNLIKQLGSLASGKAQVSQE